MYKKILSSTLPLVVSVILSVIVGNYGFGRISSLQAEIAQARQNQSILTQKISMLQSVSATVGTGSQIAASALPEKNPAIAALSQIKSLAVQNVVALTNLKAGAGAQDASGLSATGITFDVAGPRAGVIAFLDSIGKIAPITMVDRIKLTENGGVSQATIAVRSFWAGFPKNLPAATENLTDFTPAERDVLNKISGLTQPQFVELPPTQGGKTDPFAE